MLALVISNSCYASYERIFQPDSRRKLIVVMSNNDSFLVICNKKAKAFKQKIDNADLNQLALDETAEREI